MSVFIGTYENKVDRKGRVSIPVSFRQILATSAFSGIVTFQYNTPNAMEACSLESMQELDVSISEYDLFSEEYDDLAFSILANSYQLPFDSEGRVILPPAVIETTGITERAAFVGKGPLFQIWEPEALKVRKAEAMARSQSQRRPLRFRRNRPEPVT